MTEGQVQRGTGCTSAGFAAANEARSLRFPADLPRGGRGQCLSSLLLHSQLHSWGLHLKPQGSGCHCGPGPSGFQADSNVVGGEAGGGFTMRPRCWPFRKFLLMLLRYKRWLSSYCGSVCCDVYLKVTCFVPVWGWHRVPVMSQWLWSGFSFLAILRLRVWNCLGDHMVLHGGSHTGTFMNGWFVGTRYFVMTFPYLDGKIEKRKNW